MMDKTLKILSSPESNNTKNFLFISSFVASSRLTLLGFLLAKISVGSPSGKPVSSFSDGELQAESLKILNWI